MLSTIDVKFIFDSVHLCLSSSANILQIADVALRIVFFLSEAYNTLRDLHMIRKPNSIIVLSFIQNHS